jgi:hypothetical protein
VVIGLLLPGSPHWWVAIGMSLTMTLVFGFKWQAERGRRQR